MTYKRNENSLSIFDYNYDDLKAIFDKLQLRDGFELFYKTKNYTSKISVRTDDETLDLLEKELEDV